MEFLKRVFGYISSHFLLRNLVMFLCMVLVLGFLATLALNLFTRHGQRLIVPDLSGMTISEAERVAKELGLTVEVVDSLFVPKEVAGAVLDQSPNAGMGVKSGRKLFLVINAQEARKEIIPYVSGYSLRQAKNLLENKGFEISRLVYKEDLATNNVLGERFGGIEITAGSSVKATLGSGVELIVGRNSGSPLPVVPKVIGLTLREAKSRLWEMGLNVGEVKPDGSVDAKEMDRAKVYQQTPNQQMRAGYGTAVVLHLTNEIDKISEGNKKSDVQARTYADGSDEEQTGGQEEEI